MMLQAHQRQSRIPANNTPNKPLSICTRTIRNAVAQPKYHTRRSSWVGETETKESRKKAGVDRHGLIKNLVAKHDNNLR